MSALWVENQALQLRQDIPLPEPQIGEALIRVRLAGICATDLELVRGYYPFAGVPGHEFVGEVLEAPGKSTLAGQRVVGEINLACGHCEQCLSGRKTHCENRRVLGIKNQNGAFAQYLTLPIANLHRVPDNVKDEAAVFAEPLAAALEIQEQVDISQNDRVLVIGAGRLGQLIARTLQLTGCRLAVVARHVHHGTLLENCGICALHEGETPDGKWDVVVEVTGNPDGFLQARRAVRPRGTIVLKSTFKGENVLNLSAVVVDEITLVGSRCGPFRPALSLLANHEIDPLPLVEGRYSLSQGIQAFAHAARPGALKILVDPTSPAESQL
ncbi:MAG: alcohol dehydrogenase [Chloroflexi bacterium RBG_16_54_18]|nr:MAG: alcohol dehydrogenase [Chloroflexi bacterium RBG_16_54_18]